jgi:hypothetical protein
MKHFLTNTALASLAIIVIALAGCKPPEATYTEVRTASIRVVNFASSCTVPLDVYWYPADQPRPKQANVYYLQFGGAAVYTNGLVVGPNGTPYKIEVHPTNDTNKILISSLMSQPKTLLPGIKYTLAIALNESDPTQYSYNFVEDLDPGDSNDQFAHVRFMNMQPHTGKLELKLNDPLTGQIINPGGTDYLQIDPLKYADVAAQPKDVSYTLFLTPAGSSQILARLAFQTFEQRNHYTIVYSGDTCRLKNPNDTTGVDNLRLRNLDDNTGGSDLTNPIQPAFRYNIINGVMFDPSTYVGFSVNGETYPQFGGYSIMPVHPFEPGGFTVTKDGNIWNVAYQSGSIPNPIPVTLNIRGSKTDAVGSFNNPVFDAKVPMKDIHPDSSFTFLLVDTTIPPPGATGGLPAVKTPVAIPIPDESKPDAAIIVFIQGIVSNKRPDNGNNAYASFWVSQDNGTTQPLLYVASSNQGSAAGKYQVVSYPVAAGGSTNITVNDSIGKSGAKVPGPMLNFTAQAGGIYEVALLGSKGDPHIIAFRANPKPKQQ